MATDHIQPPAHDEGGRADNQSQEPACDGRLPQDSGKPGARHRLSPLQGPVSDVPRSGGREDLSIRTLRALCDPFSPEALPARGSQATSWTAGGYDSLPVGIIAVVALSGRC